MFLGESNYRWALGCSWLHNFQLEHGGNFIFLEFAILQSDLVLTGANWTCTCWFYSGFVLEILHLSEGAVSNGFKLGGSFNKVVAVICILVQYFYLFLLFNTYHLSGVLNVFMQFYSGVLTASECTMYNIDRPLVSYKCCWCTWQTVCWKFRRSTSFSLHQNPVNDTIHAWWDRRKVKRRGTLEWTRSTSSPLPDNFRWCAWPAKRAKDVVYTSSICIEDHWDAVWSRLRTLWLPYLSLLQVTYPVLKFPRKMAIWVFWRAKSCTVPRVFEPQNMYMLWKIESWSHSMEFPSNINSLYNFLPHRALDNVSSM